MKGSWGKGIKKKQQKLLEVDHKFGFRLPNGKKT